MIYFLYNDTLVYESLKKLLEDVIGKPSEERKGGDMWAVFGKDSQKKAREWERDCNLQLELNLGYDSSGEIGTIKQNETVVGRYYL